MRARALWSLRRHLVRSVPCGDLHGAPRPVRVRELQRWDVLDTRLELLHPVPRRHVRVGDGGVSLLAVQPRHVCELLERAGLLQLPRWLFQRCAST